MSLAAIVLAMGSLIPIGDVPQNEVWLGSHRYCILDDQKIDASEERYWSPIFLVDYRTAPPGADLNDEQLETDFKNAVLSAHPHLASIPESKDGWGSGLFVNCTFSWTNLTPSQLLAAHKSHILGGNADDEIFVNFKPSGSYWRDQEDLASPSDGGSSGTFGAIEVIEGSKPKSSEQIKAEKLSTLQALAAAKVKQDAASARDAMETRRALAMAIAKLQARGRGQ